MADNDTDDEYDEIGGDDSGEEAEKASPFRDLSYLRTVSQLALKKILENKALEQQIQKQQQSQQQSQQQKELKHQEEEEKEEEEKEEGKRKGKGREEAKEIVKAERKQGSAILATRLKRRKSAHPRTKGSNPDSNSLQPSVRKRRKKPLPLVDDPFYVDKYQQHPSSAQKHRHHKPSKQALALSSRESPGEQQKSPREGQSGVDEQAKAGEDPMRGRKRHGRRRKTRKDRETETETEAETETETETETEGNRERDRQRDRQRRDRGMEREENKEFEENENCFWGLYQELKATEKRLEAGLCQYCGSRSRQMLYLPCRHLLYCHGCSHVLCTNGCCPACKTQIARSISIMHPPLFLAALDYHE